MEMEMIAILLAGVIGTFIMTMFMLLLSVTTGYNFRVPLILGNMATLQTKPSGATARSAAVVITGNLLHYAVGVLLAYIYDCGLKIWNLANSLSNALLFGLMAGSAAILFWFTFIKLHPLSPAIKLPLYLIGIFIGHLFFAMGVWLGLVITS